MTNNAVTTTKPGGAVAAPRSLRDLMNSDKLGGVIDDLGREAGANQLAVVWSGKSGFYTYNGEVLRKGTQLAFNMGETQKGTVCFMDGMPQHSQSISIFSKETLYSQAEMDELEPGPFGKDDGGWTRSFTFQVKFLDTGAEAPLRLSGKLYNGGGMAGAPTAAYNLLKDWGLKQRMNVDEDGNPMIPIVELDSIEKTVRGGGPNDKFYTPVLRIVDWMTQAELSAETEVEEAAAAPEAPAARAPRAAPAAAAGLGSGVRGRRT